MSSGRPNADIQSELVEILGFEGQGLQLVEELLRPRARELVMEEVRGHVEFSGKVRYDRQLLYLLKSISVRPKDMQHPGNRTTFPPTALL